MIVDMHAHLYPREYLAEAAKVVERGGGEGWARMLAYKTVNDPRFWDVPTRLADMDEAGIDVQALSLSLPNMYFLQGQPALALAQVVNDTFAAICRQHPTRFFGLAAVPLTDPELAAREVERALGPLGLHGVSLGTNVNQQPLTTPAFAPFFEAANALDATIVLHPMVPAGMEVMGEYELDMMVGYPTDTTLAAFRMIMDGMLDRYPRLRWVLPHLGGTIPYLAERLESCYTNHQHCREHMTRAPREYLREYYYDTCSYFRPAFDCALAIIPSSRIVFGTDYPFPFGIRWHKAAVPFLKELGLPEEELTGILARNALAILRHVPASLAAG